jgi:hypothetical protein
MDPTNNDVSRAGAAYEVTRSAGVWSQTKFIKSPTPTLSDNFGAAIAISGNGATIGAGTLNVDTAYVD